MRRFLRLPTLLIAFLVVVPLAGGDDGRRGGDAPTVDQLLERLLSSNAAEHAMVAQYLKQADQATVLELFSKVREAMRPGGDEPEAPDLRDLLRRMREKEADPQVALIEVSARILEFDGEPNVFFRDLGVKPPVTPALLDATEREILLRAIEKSERVRQLAAPRISMLEHQSANVSVLNQVSYISGYDLIRRPDGDMADPRVGVLQDGLVLRMKCERGGSEGAVRVRLTGTWAEVAQPLAVCDVPVGDRGGKIKIQVPHTELTCRDADVVIPKGCAALVRGADRGAAGAQWILLEAKLREVGASFLRDVLGELPPVPAGPRVSPVPPAPAPSGVVVNLEARVVEVPVERAEAVLGGTAPTDHTVTRYLGDEDVAALLARVEADADAKVVVSPRLTVYDGQQANVSMLSEVSYVQDFEVEIRNGDNRVDPIIGVLKEGLELELEPTLSTDRKVVTLELDGTWAKVIRPIPEFKTTLEGREVTIQLPELTVRRSKARLRLPDGGSVLVRPERLEDAKVESALLVRVQVVVMDDDDR